MATNQTKFKFDFLGKAKLAITVSTCFIIYSIFLWVSKGDSKYGVDYKGGSELIVAFSSNVNSEEVRKVLTKGGIDDPMVQAFENDSANEFSIRLHEGGTAKDVKNKVEQVLTGAYTSTGYTILKVDFVGPTMGAELRTKAFWAMLLSLIGMLVYITWRFEFAFALGAVVALFHDVIITFGFYLLSDRQISASALAAALTIVGYSVNDTIVIFDRVREEILKRKSFDLGPLINDAINSTLTRTIITSLLTLFSALALLIYGGGSISDLSFFLVVGIITGSYSTIFIASPIVIMWEKLQQMRALKRQTAS